MDTKGSSFCGVSTVAASTAATRGGITGGSTAARPVSHTMGKPQALKHLSSESGAVRLGLGPETAAARCCSCGNTHSRGAAATRGRGRQAGRNEERFVKQARPAQPVRYCGQPAQLVAPKASPPTCRSQQSDPVAFHQLQRPASQQRQRRRKAIAHQQREDSSANHWPTFEGYGDVGQTGCQLSESPAAAAAVAAAFGGTADARLCFRQPVQKLITSQLRVEQLCHCALDSTFRGRCLISTISPPRTACP